MKYKTLNLLNPVNPMRNKNLIRLISGMLLLILGLTAQAQQATTAAGGYASGSGGSVAYSVGQVIYTTNAGATGSVIQGVQQAYEIFTVGVKDETAMNISLAVFPNPTADNLILQVTDFHKDKLIYQVFDMQGKLLGSNTVKANQTQLSMGHLPSAIYFIHVMEENRENRIVKSFKVIKN